MARPDFRLVIGGLSAALLLGACGSSGSHEAASSTSTTEKLSGVASQSPEALLAATCGATLAVQTVTVDSTFSAPRMMGGIQMMHWVMSTRADVGTVTYLIAKKPVQVQVYVEAYLTYLNAPAAWWATTTMASQSTVLANKWFSIPSTSSSNDLVAALLPASNLQGLLENCLRPERTPTKGALGRVGANQTIEVKVNGSFVLQTFFVPTMATTYLIKTTMRSASGLQSSRLSGFNTTKIPRAPQGAVPLSAPGLARS